MNFVNSFDLFGTAAKQTTCITLHGVPTATTEGAVGLFGIDVDSEDKVIYKCTEVTADGKYVWKALLEDEGYESRSIIDSAEGSLISLTNAAKAPLPKVKIYGKSTQASTTGKNKLPYPYTNTTLTSSGITFTDNGDGTVTCNGTAEETVFFKLRDLAEGFMVSAGEYTLSGCPSGGSNATYHLYCVNKSQSEMLLNDAGNGATATLASDEIYGFYIKISKGQTVSGITFKPMLRPVDTDDTYEPYTGGEASPNPNYPQEITSVGDSGSVDLKLQGKNLLTYSAGTTSSKNNGTFVVNSDMGVTAYGTPSAHVDIMLYNGETIHEDLTVSCNGLENAAGISLNVEIRKDNVLITNKSLSSNVAQISGNSIMLDKTDLIDSNKLIITLKRAGNNTTMSGVVYPILTVGAYDGVWEPPKPIQSATFETPDGLRSIPNTDIRDEIDLERKVRIQRVGEYRNTGEPMSMATGVQSADNKNIIYWNHCLKGTPAYKPDTTVAIISNYFRYYYSPYKNVYTCMHATHGNSNKSNYLYFSVYVEDLEYGTTYTNAKEAITAWLAKTFSEENPLIVWYPLAEPIETPLTDEEIAAFKALRTHKPYTTIHASGCCDAKVDYVVDPKLYIDNKINKAVEELSAAIITE